MNQAKTVCRRILHILSREGATLQVSSFVCKAVIQAVLLFRAEIWVVTPHMFKALGRVSDPGGETDDETAPTEDNRNDMEIYLGGSGKGGGGFVENVGIRQAAP